MFDEQELFQRHSQDVKRLKNQRYSWLIASSIVVIGIIFVIFRWEWLESISSRWIWWVIISFLFMITSNWLYWTMRMIRLIIDHQAIEYRLIKIILDELHAVKRDLKIFKSKP